MATAIPIECDPTDETELGVTQVERPSPCRQDVLPHDERERGGHERRYNWPRTDDAGFMHSVSEADGPSPHELGLENVVSCL